MSKIIKNPFERKHKGALFALCVVCMLLAGCFSSCKKDDIDMSKIDFSNIEDLYAQPLPVIQKCVQGKWQVKGTYGGIAGWNPAPENVFVEINENKLNGSEFQWVKHTKQNWDWETPFNTYAIQQVGFEPSLYFKSIKNDSLNVGYAPNNPCYDCFTGILWVRSK